MVARIVPPLNVSDECMKFITDPDLFEYGMPSSSADTLVAKSNGIILPVVLLLFGCLPVFLFKKGYFRPDLKSLYSFMEMVSFAVFLTVVLSPGVFTLRCDNRLLSCILGEPGNTNCDSDFFFNWDWLLLGRRYKTINADVLSPARPFYSSSPLEWYVAHVIKACASTGTWSFVAVPLAGLQAMSFILYGDELDGAQFSAKKKLFLISPVFFNWCFWAISSLREAFYHPMCWSPLESSTINQTFHMMEVTLLVYMLLLLNEDKEAREEISEDASSVQLQHVARS